MEKPSNTKAPSGLEEILDYGWPDALWIEATPHAPDTYSVWILDLDYSYTEWLACLSLDGRWTVSPRSPVLYPSALVEVQGGLF